jgi:predicted RNase H-like HicB family nuclease
MLPEYQNLGLRFQEIKEAYAQAKTLEEKRELLALAWEIVRQAEEQAAQLKSEIQRMKKS